MTDQGEPSVARIPDALLDYDEELTYTYNGERFTGIAYDDVPGRGLSEISYVGGWQEGPSRDWYPSGQLRSETMYKGNGRHGHSREFRQDGTMSSEMVYEHSVLVQSATFDTDGNTIASFEISEDGPGFAYLQRLRKQFG